MPVILPPFVLVDFELVHWPRTPCFFSRKLKPRTTSELVCPLTFMHSNQSHSKQPPGYIIGQPVPITVKSFPSSPPSRYLLATAATICLGIPRVFDFFRYLTRYARHTVIHGHQWLAHCMVTKSHNQTSWCSLSSYLYQFCCLLLSCLPPKHTTESPLYLLVQFILYFNQWPYLLQCQGNYFIPLYNNLHVCHSCKIAPFCLSLAGWPVVNRSTA